MQAFYAVCLRSQSSVKRTCYISKRNNVFFWQPPFFELFEILAREILVCSCMQKLSTFMGAKSFKCVWSLTVTKVRSLQQEGLGMNVFIPNPPGYMLIAIIFDIARFGLIGSLEESSKRHFMKLEFDNKVLNSINISNFLNRKKENSAVPSFFKS